MNLPEVAHRPPLEIGTPTQPIAFAGGTSKISHGTQVGAFPSYGGPWSFTCGKGSRISLEWGGRMAAAWSSELGEIFYDTLKAAGYDVVGNPQRLFDRGRDLARARYQVGARLLDLRGNFCSEVNFWTGEFSNRYRGLSYIRVEWEVYSVPERRVIAKLLSEGRGKMDEPAVEGNVRSLQLAFADAAANLAADPAFLELVSADPGKAVRERRPPVPKEVLVVAGVKPSRHVLKERMDTVLDGVVTILTARAQGSGFFVGRAGYGLTNAHVTGQAKTVMVHLRSGVEVEAEVLRVDPVRDVALFKAPVQVLHPLAVASSPSPKRLDEVYAAGTPLGFQNTVTKGVVSAFRQMERGGRLIDFIQADVLTTHGNSGGPLLDGRGNVVGLSVSGILENDGSASGMNLFIPIASALEALHVQMDTEEER